MEIYFWYVLDVTAESLYGGGGVQLIPYIHCSVNKLLYTKDGGSSLELNHMVTINGADYTG